MTLTGPLEDEPFDPEVESSRLLAPGAVWDVREDVFRYGDETLTRHYVDHPGAVMVLAVDEQNRALLIRQYRHPIGQREWEIPGGLMDQPGELPLAAAKRELLEEAGLVAQTWHVLLDTVTSAGGSTELIRIYLAQQLSEGDSDFVPDGEEADMERRWVDVTEIRDAIFAARVQNGPLLHGVLALLQARSADLRPADAPWPRRDLVRGERTGLEHLSGNDTDRC